MMIAPSLIAHNWNKYNAVLVAPLMPIADAAVEHVRARRIVNSEIHHGGLARDKMSGGKHAKEVLLLPACDLLVGTNFPRILSANDGMRHDRFAKGFRIPATK